MRGTQNNRLKNVQKHVPLKGKVSISSRIRFNDDRGQNVQINNCEIHDPMEQNYLEYRALDQTCIPDQQQRVSFHKVK